jgi:hypothetical protein
MDVVAMIRRGARFGAQGADGAIRRCRTAAPCRYGRLACTVLAAILHAASASAAASLISATIEPHEITVGQSAVLTIVTVGKDLGGLSLPSVGGLQFRVIAQAERGNDIHGASVMTTTTRIRVTPIVSGDFQIPGMAANAPPLLLHVEPDESQHKPARAAGTAAAPALDGIHLAADGSSFVRLVLPKREVYVGESVPVDIEVGLRPGMVTSLNGLPTLTSGEFTLNNLSRQPERGERAIGGSAFSIFTWHSVIAPIKPGIFTLAVQSPITIRMRVRSAGDAKLDALLGDPFLQNYYGKSVTKEMKIASPPATLSVLGLPIAGRPGDFSGAVGNFKAASEIVPAIGTAGEPLTLRLRIGGSGNFDRVDSAMFTQLEHWKTYPAKSSFKPSDAVGYVGEKTFEQPLIASRTGSEILPPLRFSYFDPVARNYATLATAPLTVNITLGPGDDMASPAAQGSASSPATNGNAALGVAGAPFAAPSAAAAASGLNALRPDHAPSERVSHSLLPLYLQPRFYSIPAGLALVWLGLWWRWRRAENVPSSPRPSASRLRAAADIEAVARTGDAARFFHTASAALRDAFAERWQVAADTVTAASFVARQDETPWEISEVFRIADEMQYAGRGAARIDLARWSEIVRRELLRGGRP